MVDRFVVLNGSAVDLLPGGVVGLPSITNTATPTITGTAQVGATLTATTGTWNVTPDWYSYQWRRNNSPIPGATASLYVPVTADVGQQISCAVVANKSGYTASVPVVTATVTITAGVVASAGLFFDASAIQQPDTFTHKSYPHWWPATPRSMSNSLAESSDWYSTGMNNPESASYSGAKPYGGASRERAMFRPQVAGSTAQWHAVDHRFDIDTAIDHGHDGFFADIINTWKPWNDGLIAALRVARGEDPQRYGKFEIIPMIDANSPSVYSTTAVAGDYVLTYSDVTKWVNIGGVDTMLWAVWHPGAVAASTWKNIQTYILGQGVPNRMVGTWNSTYTSTTSGPGASTYAGLLYAEGPWGAGAADPVSIANNTPTSTSYGNAATSRGNLYVHPVRSSEIRPNPSQGPWWDEADGTKALQAQWEQVLGNANSAWVEPVTWSDWTEGTAFAPGTHCGYARLIISAYYMHRWKTGSYPTILTDAIVLSHRQHNLSAPVQYAGQTQTLPQRNAGSAAVSTPKNKAEALVWLTAPATVRIVDQNGDHDFSAPAGMSTHETPLVVGVAPKVEVWRSGEKVAEVQSTRTVDANPWRTDWTYWQFTNLRPLTYQTRIPGPNPPYP